MQETVGALTIDVLHSIIKGEERNVWYVAIASEEIKSCATYRVSSFDAVMDCITRPRWL